MYMSDNSDGRYVTNQSHISKTVVKKKHNESTVINRLLEDDLRRREQKKNFEQAKAEREKMEELNIPFKP